MSVKFLKTVVSALSLSLSVSSLSVLSPESGISSNIKIILHQLEKSVLFTHAFSLYIILFIFFLFYQAELITYTSAFIQRKKCRVMDPRLLFLSL